MLRKDSTDVPGDPFDLAAGTSGDCFERDSRDVLALQDELALAIAREINVELTPHEQARLANSPTVDPQAHDAYLKGRYFLSSPTEERVRKALEQFEQAIRVDPHFALPYSGIADAYILGDDFYFPPTEAMPKAKAQALQPRGRKYRCPG